MAFLSLSTILFCASAYAAVTPPYNNQPIVSLSYATFQGVTNGSVTQFLGIPYAEPPARFTRATPPKRLKGIQKADQYGAACPQQTYAKVPYLTLPDPHYANISEDCLTINVIKPATHTATQPKLPVLLWFRGNGFETGDASDNSPIPLVERSISNGQPILFVSFNFRQSAFGFLTGKEAAKAGVANLGIRDQILALEWVQKYIAQFGGDPNKVTAVGINSGAISISIHMLINDGKSPKFAGAFLMSGGPSKISPIADDQNYYDQLVHDTNCTNAKDSLDCMRKVPYSTMISAILKTPGLFAYSALNNVWKARIDGDLIKKAPYCLIAEGRYARIPMIAGSSDDEGTMFSLSQLNVTTEDEFNKYMQTYLLATTTEADIRAVDKAYPSDPVVGSPFDTGTNNTITPQFKRLAAVQGDLTFQAPRRYFLEAAAKTQKTWSYLYKRGKLPVLGVFHDSDLSDWFAIKTADFVASDSLIRFVNTLNPNGGKPKNATYWPEWGSSHTDPPLLTFTDPAGVGISPDTYRSEGFNLLSKLLIEMARNEGVC